MRHLFIFSGLLMLLCGSCKKEVEPKITSLNYTINNCAAPYSVTFTYSYDAGTASGAQQCEWQLADSIVSDDCGNMTVVIPSPGTYITKLTIRKGSAIAVKEVIVDVSQSSYPVISSFNLGSIDIYQSCSATFDNQSEHATQYKWYFGDGDSSSLFEPTHQYPAAGTYTVQLAAMCNGQTQVSSKSVYVYANPSKANVNRLYLELAKSYLDSDADDNSALPDYYWDVYLDNVYQFSSSTITNISSFPQNWYFSNASVFLASDHTVTFKLWESDPGTNNDDFVGSYYFTTAYLRNNCYPTGFWMGNNVYCYLSY